MSKSNLALICLLFLCDANAAIKLSGNNFSGTEIKYDTREIKTYGRIVIGAAVNTTEGPEGKTQVIEKQILFCGTGEIFEYESEANEYKSDGTFAKRIYKNESRNNTIPISREKTEQYWLKFTGLTGLYLEMSSKCGSANLKYPRIEIPIARSETTVFHLILDTFSNDGKWRYIWIKDQKIRREESKMPNGQPVVFKGEAMYEYKFIEPRNFSMVRYVFDCTGGKQAISHAVDYKSNGEVLKTDSYDTNRLRFDHPIPDTVGESIQKWVCNL